jgi:hypothetical protein
MKCYLCLSNEAKIKVLDSSRDQFVDCPVCGRYIIAYKVLFFFISPQKLGPADLEKLSIHVRNNPPRVDLKMVETVTGRKSEGQKF